jgi:sugar lactone lactonase YvrE
MSEDTSRENPPLFVPPVSTFTGPVAELIAQRMLLPPSRPGLLARLDQFEILRVLGGGGMGIVLLARDPATGREVAIKLVKSDLVTNQNAIHRFLKEAGHLKRLRHANVVAVQEISDWSEGPYFVMPYFEKGSLAGRIKPGKPLDDEAILAIAAQVAEGLSFAHRSGIIHRDLKPANILLTADGQACLADFGLARTLFNDTMVDMENRNLEGTAPYMSPGVAAGDAEDTRCDIYSFGALLYEMLTGHPPYQGRSTKEILNQIIAGPPQPIISLNPAADRGLVTVTEGCMARELRDRYADMRDVLKDLERIKENKPLAGQRGFKGAAGDQRFTVRRVLKIIWLPACLTVIVFVSWMLWRERSPVVTPPPMPVPAVARPAALKTTALAGQIGFGGYADGAGNQAQFRLPNSVAVDPAGNVYVADTANNIIRKITPDGFVSTLAGVPGTHGSTDGPGKHARFWAPFGITVDRAGNVYVADTANNIIRKITPDGFVSTLAGSVGHPGNQDGTGSNAQFRNPWGVAVTDQGNVFVADMSNNTIRKISPTGVVSTLAGQAGVSGSRDGMGADAQFNNPFALAVDPEDNIYVSDSANNTIRKITPNGAVSTLAGLPGQAGSTDGNGTTARFWNPQGLVTDDHGNIYVADTGNNIVRKITPTGIVTTLAGPAGINGIPGEVGAVARFNNPSGVAIDRVGNVYVADTNNHAVRKMSLAAAGHP